MDHRREVAEAAGPGLFDLMRVGIGYLACELELGFIFFLNLAKGLPKRC